MSRQLATARRWAAAFTAFTVAIVAIFVLQLPADAALVPPVPLGSAAAFSVLAASTVTSTGTTTLDGSVGVWAGTAVTGAPVVLPPGTVEAGTPAAQLAQSDVGTAYADAAGRSIDTTTGTELGGQTLAAGVFGTPARDALTLNGALVLDGGGNPNSVFIFQTDSTLITGAGSRVTLVNGAQECNVFWRVGSSATLGIGSDIAGTILASASITATTGAIVHGRALAHGAAVTLDTNRFFAPTCDLTPPVTTATTAVPVTTTTTAVPVTTTTTAVPVTTTTTDPGAGATGATLLGPPDPGSSGAPLGAAPAGATLDPATADGIPRVVGAPRTGGTPMAGRSSDWLAVMLIALLVGIGIACIPNRHVRRDRAGRP